MPSTKTLRVTLSDIVGGTGGSGSTAVVHARYVTANGQGRDVHLTDGTIVVPVRRSVTPGTGPEEFDFVVIPSDDGDVREVDRGFLTEVSWTVTAPEGGKSHGVRRVLITADMGATVHLGLLAQPEPVAPYTGGYALAPDLAAEVATRAAADAALDVRVDALEVAPPAHAHAGADITSGTVAYARLPVGTAASTLAAGDDSRITGAAQKSANLSDLASASTARTNLGLTDSAVVGALPIPDPGSFYPTDTITAALQLIGGREQYGTGSPEGVVTAPVGTYYTDTALTNGAMRWAKKTGTGNTGWQCIEGDTGWRGIDYATAGSPAAWSSTGWALRFYRIGNVVYYRQTANASASWAGSSDSVYVLPSGFRPDPRAANSGGVQSRNSSTGGTVFWILSAVTNSFRAQAGLSASQGSGDVMSSFVTADAWPTTLPGTAG